MGGKMMLEKIRKLLRALLGANRVSMDGLPTTELRRRGWYAGHTLADKNR
jgi:hypothetical protein